MSLNEAKKAVSRLERSFFDVPNASEPFWKQTDASDFSNYTRYMENEFHTRTSKCFQVWESCSLALQNSFLVYRKRKTSKIVEYIDLDEHIYKIKVLSTHDSRDSGKYKHGFSIYGNGKSFDFYCKEKSQLTKWLIQFRKSCVMADFYENYNICETIGVGGYGEVRLLQDKVSKTKRAGKFIRILDDNDRKAPRQKSMIMHEIKILRKLEHPNIVKIFELYEVGAEICIVMELIEGQNLLQYITREKKINEKETAVIMKQLFLVLNYLASMEIIHRDIKSENIMLVRNKEGKINIKLIDFGLSTFAHNKDVIKRCGTPGYVAPEVFVSDQYDFRVDLYSAGVILYSCLTGKPPFVADNYEELLEKNKKGLVNYKGKSWTQVSVEGKSLIQKLLEPAATRISLEDAICHNWLQENLDAEDKKYLNEYRFHIVKMNVPEETRISSVPTNVSHSSRLSKGALHVDHNNNRFHSSNSFLMSTLAPDQTNRLNSFYKPSVSITKDLNGSGEETMNSLTKLKPQLQGSMQGLETSMLRTRSNPRDLSPSVSPTDRYTNERSRSREDKDKEEDILIRKLSAKPTFDAWSDDLQVPEDFPSCGERYSRFGKMQLCFSKMHRPPSRNSPQNVM